MAFVHNVEIIWDELIDAFTSVQVDRVYFLDRQTGEIFFIPSSLEEDEIWQQIEAHRDRFLEIPRFDYGVERQLMAGFIGAVEDDALKELLRQSIAGSKPFGKISDIISFFPEENDRLVEMKDEFLASRVKDWLEANDLYYLETENLRLLRI